jgi:hypothetical protein
MCSPTSHASDQFNYVLLLRRVTKQGTVAFALLQLTEPAESTFSLLYSWRTRQPTPTKALYSPSRLRDGESIPNRTQSDGQGRCERCHPTFAFLRIRLYYLFPNLLSVLWCISSINNILPVAHQTVFEKYVAKVELKSIVEDKTRAGGCVGITQNLWIFSFNGDNSAVTGAGTAQWYSAGLRAGWWVRIPAEVGNFSRHRVQTGSGAHPASYPMGTRGSLPGGKAAADHSPPCSVEVKDCMELYLHSPNTSSWRGAQLKHRTTLPLHLPLLLP